MPGVGFKLTDDGNYDIDGKRLTNVSQPTDGSDATTKAYVDSENTKQDIAIADKASKNDLDTKLDLDGSKQMTGNLNMNSNKIINLSNGSEIGDSVNYSQLLEHTENQQINYHLQPSFTFYKNFGDKSKLTYSSLVDPFPNHKHHGLYSVKKERFNSNFGGEALVSLKITNKLPSGNYTLLFESFSAVINSSFTHVNDEVLNSQVFGHNGIRIITFDHDSQTTFSKSIIQFYTDGNTGDITFQMQSYGTNYNNPDLYFLFYSRVVSGKQSLAFNHALFDVDDVQLQNQILYFEDVNLNGNMVSGLGDPQNDTDSTNKKYVDTEISKLPKPATDVLKLDGSKAMTGNLDMGGKAINNIKDPSNGQDAATKIFVDNAIVAQNSYIAIEMGKKLNLIGGTLTGDLNMNNNEIKNLKDPQVSDNTYAATVNFVNKTVSDSNAVISTLIDKKIKESETSSIDLVDQENVFKRVMDNDEFKEDDDDIHKIGVKNKDFHLVNKKTYEFKIDYDSDIGYYSTRLSIDLLYLPEGSYTMVFEMYVEDGITIDEIEGASGTLSGVTTKSNIDGTKTRSIIHFSYNGLASGFNDLDIDIKLKSKTDPKTTIYVVVYGVKGKVNNVSVGLWDRLYYYDNDSINYEVPIDMKGKKIMGVGNGTSNSDAVNHQQLINHIKTINSYFYYTNYLEHDNENKVKFPAISQYPYSAIKNSENLRISLEGYYQIIYTDAYKRKCKFIINDATNDNYLFVQYFDDVTNWTPITVSTVIKVDIKPPTNYVNIKMNIKDPDRLLNPIFDGINNSTFFIKYLN